jgi:hypothetical protein
MFFSLPVRASPFGVPVVASHSRIVLSSPPQASTRLSGVNAAEYTTPSCPTSLVGVLAAWVLLPPLLRHADRRAAPHAACTASRGAAIHAIRAGPRKGPP